MSTAAATSTNPKVEAVPSSWPGAFGVYKHSRAAVMTNIDTIVLGILSVIAVGIVYSILSSALGLPAALSSLLQTLFNFYVTLVEIIILFACIDGAKITLGDALQKSKPYIWQALLLGVLLSVIAAGSLILLIVPFFFIMPRLALAPFYLVRKNMTATDALQASWDKTKGNVGKVYGLVGVNILIALLMVTIIGIPFAIYFGVMYAAAFNILYAYIVERGSAAK